MNSLFLNSEINSIYNSAISWQEDLLKIGLPFSQISDRRKSIDAVSLHIDLAHMIKKNSWCKKEINWLKNKQDLETGLWFESYTKDLLKDHDNPRVIEMVGTYLGFQVSSLFISINEKANLISFWNVLKGDNKNLINYLEKMPWHNSPWGAGGWVDSISTMMIANYKWGDYEFKEVLSRFIDWLNNKQSSITGLWGDDQIQGIAGQINGTYHLSRGTFFSLDINMNYEKKLLNSLIEYLKQDEHFFDDNGEACYDLDASFLLYKLHRRLPKYRAPEIKEFAERRLKTLFSRRNNDGLYGYFIDSSQDFHNYHFVGPREKGVSDIQGTVFYMTTIFYLIRIMNPSQFVPWEASLTHG